MNNEKRQLASLLTNVGFFTGKSIVYNTKKMYENPKVYKKFIVIVSKCIKKNFVLCACDEGVFPFVGGLSLYSGVPALFLRKTKKNYSTSFKGVKDNLIFGSKTQKNVQIFDDISKSGKSLLRAIKILRAKGYVPKEVLILLNLNKTNENIIALKKEGISVKTIINAEELEAYEKSFFTNKKR